MADIVLYDNISYMQSDHCGYCSGKKARAVSSSHGFQVDSISTKAYQSLVDSGWRRSGSYIYRNDMLRSCCSHYTIRTNLDFVKGKKAKEPRKVMNKFYKWAKQQTNEDDHKGVGSSLMEKFINNESNNEGSFRTELTPAKYDDIKYNLFKKYQMAIHKDEEDELSPKSFKRFLCTDPFGTDETLFEKMNEEWSKREPGELISQFQGAMHECYYYQDQLIALAVLDVLDHAISSVYFIYDPDFGHLGLGTVSAVREMCMTEIWERGWYYLGYYIPDCTKMKYKAKFGGEILDIGHYDSKSRQIDHQWWDLEAVAKILDDGKFHTFERDSDSGLIIEVTDKLYGLPGGKYQQILNVNATDMSPILMQRKDEEAQFDKTHVEKTCNYEEGPLVVPGCRLIEPSEKGFIKEMNSALENVRILDYRQMRMVREILPELAVKQTEICRVICDSDLVIVLVAFDI